MKKIVVAGCGGMAGAWVGPLVKRSDVQIVGLMDLIPENCKRYQENFKLDCPIFTDLETAIRETGADLVIDVTIPSAHPTVVQTALKNGCDVFGEKPMAESLVEAQQMLATVAATGKTYTVMQNYRYNEQIQAFADIAREGKIGQIGYLGADFFLAPRFGGFREAMESPLLKDMSIHTFDAARFILQADPVSVYCHEFNPAGSWYNGKASAVAIFEMSNGAVFCYRGSWCAQGFENGWDSNWRMQGSKGAAIWVDEKMPEYAVVTDGKEERFVAEAKYTGQDGHAGCIDEMFECLYAGKKAQTDCSDNIKSISMVLKACESAATGKKIYF